MASILIIEDSAFMRGLIRKILNADGHSIMEAEDGIKGLQLATQSAPDCVLLDLIMPGVDGFKILQLLKERKENVPVVVITADIQESVRKQCLDLGAAAFINKPPREDELRGAIGRVLSSRKEASR